MTEYNTELTPNENIGQNRRESKSENKKRQKKKHSLLFRFFRVVIITLGVFVILFAALVFGYTRLFSDSQIAEAIAKELNSNLMRDGSIFDIFSSIPEHTNFVILGLDEGDTRTDLIMVGSYNSKTHALDIISVPRDTYAVIPEERRAILKAQNLYCPSTGEMKINAVHHYAGSELGTEFIVKQLEDIFGITVQYYVKVDLQAFRDIVDEIGGVEFDVPQRMYYRDPTQGLYIDLQPGPQTLSGKEAEGLVRYRKSDENNPISSGYAEGDLKRVRVQQDFMKALVSQLFTREKLLSNPAGIFSTATKYIKTNFPATEIAKYASSLTNFSMENINTYTVPYYMDTINGSSYVVVDKAETAKLVDTVFYSSKTKGDEAEKTTTGSFDKKISILNGGYTKGAAANAMERLEALGYNIISIGDSSEAKRENTIIRVKNEGNGADLLELFEHAEIEVGGSLPSGVDILIIIGTL